MILVLDLALALGAGGGYLWWARENRILRQELAEARRAADARQPAAQAWTVRGIVRLVQRSQGVIWLTHEAISGLMEGMTMPFEVEREALLDGLTPGDAVRFTLRPQGTRLLVSAIEKEAQR